jgi:ribosome maturation factor RimP
MRPILYNAMRELAPSPKGSGTKWASRPLFLLGEGPKSANSAPNGKLQGPETRGREPENTEMRTHKSIASAAANSMAHGVGSASIEPRQPLRPLAPMAPMAPMRPMPPPAARTPLTALAPEIEAELAESAAAAGCELIHAEWKGGLLRLVLDRPDAADSPDTGVSLADCERVAKQASALLDVLDFGQGRYLLEVSSPGLDRQLYRPSDYRRFLGRLVRVTWEEEPAADAAVSPAGLPDGADRRRPRPRRLSQSPRTAKAPRRPRRTVVARLAEFHPPLAAPVPGQGDAAGGPAAGAGTGGEITLLDERTGERLRLPLAHVRLARLEVEL